MKRIRKTQSDYIGIMNRDFLIFLLVSAGFLIIALIIGLFGILINFVKSLIFW